MRRPRFTIRSLLALVLIVGSMLAAGVLCVQNYRLRAQNARLEQFEPPVPSVWFDNDAIEANGQWVPSVTWRLAQPVPQTDRAASPAPVDTMPSGPDAFEK